MKTESKSKLRQLKSGVHLVCITDALIIKDSNQMPLITPDGETGITIRFSTGDNHHYDQDYWLNGNRQSYFNKMCASAKIDTTNPKFRAESKGKRLWICVKEVYDIDGDKIVTDELTGPSINYYMFDTIPCTDPLKKPVVKGNPDDNDGVASGVFLDYRDTQIDSPVTKAYVIKNGVKHFSPDGKLISESDALYTESTMKIEEVLEKYGDQLGERTKQAMQDLIVTGKAIVKPIEIKPKPNDQINWDEF